MAEGVLESTRQLDLQPLVSNGVPVFRMFGQIRVELLRSLSQDHLALFADPNPDPVSGDIQWYAPCPGNIVRLADCPEDARSGYEFHLARLVDDITNHIERLNASSDANARQMANVLAMALEVPDEQHIFVVGEQPVLAGWGHVPRGPAVMRQPLIALARRVLSISQPVEPPPAPPADAAAPAEAAKIADAPPQEPAAPEPAAAPVVAGGPRVFATIPLVNERAAFLALSWLLWPILAALLLAIGYLLLRYCALGWPLTLLADRNLIVNYCVANTELRNDDLSGHLADLQAALAEKQRRLCTVVPTPAPIPPPTPAPVPTPNTLDTLRNNNPTALIGRVNVILSWHSEDDLDLYVTCPSGAQIFHRAKTQCDGILDTDANATGTVLTPSPVENIAWANTPPAGTYKVQVDPFKFQVSGTSVPFKVELRINGELVEEHSGTASSPGMLSVMEFTIPYNRPGAPRQ